jgi:copper chaperone CopZ
MSYYIHDIPGRLRVKTPAIKGNGNAAEEVQRLLNVIEGIDSTSVNTTTGSVVINYDAKAVQSGKILDTLKDSGYLDPSKTVTNDDYFEAAVSKVGGVVSKALIGLLLEKTFEGSALSLLTVLI